MHGWMDTWTNGHMRDALDDWMNIYTTDAFMDEWMDGKRSG